MPSKKVELPIDKILKVDIGLSLIMSTKLPVAPSWRFGEWKESTEKVTKKSNKQREEFIKELGAKKPDGSVQLLNENKPEYQKRYDALMAETATMEVPEINVDLIKDILMTVRFTTLIGHYLKNDTKYPKEKYTVTNKIIQDANLGVTAIMDQGLPMPLAMKLGETKRKFEEVNEEYTKLRDELLKNLGERNAQNDLEIKDLDKQEEYDKAIEAWEEKKISIEVPTFFLSDFEVKIPVEGSKKDKKELEFPAKFFTLMRPFIKEKKMAVVAEEEEEQEE